jgi:diguanylate cyclase (GGDEF)-like protein
MVVRRALLNLYKTGPMASYMLRRPLAENLTYAVASLSQRRAALATVLGLLFFAVITAPFGERRMGEFEALGPAITSAVMVAMFVSAGMLRNQYHTTRYVPFAVLAVAYATTAILQLPYLLTFPHVFSANGFGFGPQVATYFWLTWHAAFVLLVAGYVWADSYFSRNAVEPLDAAEFLRRYTLLAGVCTAGVIAAIVFHKEVPALISAGGYTPLYHLLVEQLLLASACIVMATLIARNALRHTTHLWLCVVLAAFAIETYVSGELVGSRFSLGWYMGYLEAAAWQTLFLFVQLHHANEQLAAFAADTRSLVEETKRDALTGLFNRRGFDDRFELALADCEESNSWIALLVLDLDHFKAYNDHFGHLAGDEALRRVAAEMTSLINRPSDACCRVGGEEFAIILGGTDEAGAKTLAERLRLGVMRLRIRQAPEIPVPTMTVSIGLAVEHTANVPTAKALYERADQALYRAKRTGRNRVVAHNEPRDPNLRIVKLT